MKRQVRIYDFDYSLGDSYQCPSCGRRHMCRPHRYVYRKWYRNYRAKMLDRASRYPDLFPAADWHEPD
jgi:hypothetical protein